MGIGELLLVLFVLFLIGSLPSWSYSRSWGYYPSGFFTLVVLVLFLLLLSDRI